MSVLSPISYIDCKVAGCLPVCLPSIWLSIRMSICQSVRLSVCMSVCCSSVYLSLCLPARLYVYLPAYLSACLFDSSAIRLAICLSVLPPVSYLSCKIAICLPVSLCLVVCSFVSTSIKLYTCLDVWLCTVLCVCLHECLPLALSVYPCSRLMACLTSHPIAPITIAVFLTVRFAVFRSDWVCLPAVTWRHSWFPALHLDQFFSPAKKETHKLFCKLHSSQRAAHQSRSPDRRPEMPALLYTHRWTHNKTLESFLCQKNSAQKKMCNQFEDLQCLNVQLCSIKFRICRPS